MDNENKKDLPEQDWFDQFLSPDTGHQEIGTDESAVSAHGMSDLSDMELEKIMHEAMSEEWDLDASEEAILEDPTPEEYPDALPDESTVYADGGEAPDEETETVQRKVRPKRKNSYGLFGLPHLASIAIWAVLCVTIGVSLGRLLWICASDILAFGRVDKEVVITITDDDTVDTITEKLYSEGLIKYPNLFKFYCQLAKVEEKDKISPGIFTLNTLYDYHALVGGMSSSSSYRETIEVLIPEGYTCAQTFALLEEYGVCTVEKLEEYCTQSEFSSYWFLEDVEKGTANCLEGYLFPDTYEFYINSSAKDVFIKFLNRFDNQFTDEMITQLDSLNEVLAEKYRANGLSESYIAEHRLTTHDIVIMASIIEKETAYSGESQNIASVFYNRLTNPSNYPNLQSDATVVYAVGGRTDLTKEDFTLDSPYNTYVVTGLPAGPICNPGIYSIRAALSPASTNYYFYALDNSGETSVHRFFATYAEHLAFLQEQE